MARGKGPIEIILLLKISNWRTGRKIRFLKMDVLRIQMKSSWDLRRQFHSWKKSKQSDIEHSDLPSVEIKFIFQFHAYIYEILWQHALTFARFQFLMETYNVENKKRSGKVHFHFSNNWFNIYWRVVSQLSSQSNIQKWGGLWLVSENNSRQ